MPAEPFKFDGTLDDWKSSQIMRFCRGSALDIGCNTGALTAFLNEKGIYAEGTDSSAPHIARARQDHPGLKFNCGTDLSIYADNQFESVIGWNVLEHIEEDAAALAHMLRIASKNVILSVPKEDELSLPDSRVTYRGYVDPTHIHYYSREIIGGMIPAGAAHKVYFEDTTRVRPLLAYAKIGIPRWICAALDNLFWNLAGNRELFHANLMVVIDKVP